MRQLADAVLQARSGMPVKLILASPIGCGAGAQRVKMPDPGALGRAQKCRKILLTKPGSSTPTTRGAGLPWAPPAMLDSAAHHADYIEVFDLSKKWAGRKKWLSDRGLTVSAGIHPHTYPQIL